MSINVHISWLKLFINVDGVGSYAFEAHCEDLNSQRLLLHNIIIQIPWNPKASGMDLLSLWFFDEKKQVTFRRIHKQDLKAVRAFENPLWYSKLQPASEPTRYKANCNVSLQTNTKGNRAIRNLELCAAEQLQVRGYETCGSFSVLVLIDIDRAAAVSVDHFQDLLFPYDF